MLSSVYVDVWHSRQSRTTSLPIDVFQDAEHLAPGWPSMDECDGHNGTWTVSPRTLSTVFLSPEEKGFE